MAVLYKSNAVDTGFLLVMKNLESHAILKNIISHVWKVMEVEYGSLLIDSLGK